MVMAQFEDKIRKTIRDAASATAANEIERILEKGGFTVPKGKTSLPGTPKGELQKKVEAYYRSRTAELEAAGVQGLIAALAKPAEAPVKKVAQAQAPRPAPRKPAQLQTETATPAVRAPSTSIPSTVAPEAQPKAPMPLPTEPTPAPTLISQPVQSIGVGTTLSFRNSPCGIENFANGVGYCMPLHTTKDSAKAHFDKKLDVILSALLQKTPEAITGAKNQIISCRRALEVGATIEQATGSISEQNPNAHIIKCLGTMKFEIGGVAVLLVPAHESILRELTTKLLKPNACSAIVYTSSDGGFQVELASTYDLTKLRSQIAEQTANT
jgi:hypothetical protein